MVLHTPSSSDTFAQSTASFRARYPSTRVCNFAFSFALHADLLLYFAAAMYENRSSSCLRFCAWTLLELNFSVMPVQSSKPRAASLSTGDLAPWMWLRRVSLRFEMRDGGPTLLP